VSHDESLNRRHFLQAATLPVVAALGSHIHPTAHKTRGGDPGLQTRAFALTPDPAGYTLNGPDGRPAFTYLTRKPAGSNLKANSACCFHPVNTPSGERLTDLAPGDHVHHRGIFLAWHAMEFRSPADLSKLGPLGPTHAFEIQRADFWGWGQFAPTADRVITNRSVTLSSTSGTSAVLDIANEWLIASKKVMDEQTTASWRPGTSANVLDLTYRLTPDADLVLNQTPFGGFCVRARNDGESWYADPRGRVTRPDPHYSAADLNWPAADWYAYLITLTGGRGIGCAVVDHPKNPPATWHNPRYVWMINPCLVANSPYQLGKGQTLTLRYRVILFDGALPDPLVRQLSTEFRAS
jgi:hypothetical protein